MPRARKSQVSLTDTPYYHCVSRCVRRSFLCGEDAVSGQSYEHRRGWVEARLLYLSQIFAIDVCAYAVMSNHTHVVLHINAKQAKSWDLDEVLNRWHELHHGTYLTQAYMDDAKRCELDEAQLQAVEDIAKVYQSRLCDLSWFMRELNEHIAREANKEDQCTGRFWEGRFKSQALLDEAALAACMAYVDLNPIRAQIAKTPETSNHTSIAKRLHAFKHQSPQPSQLYDFVGNPREAMPEGLPFQLTDYIELVELTGRVIRTDKRGSIDSREAPILQRLGIDGDSWLELATELEGLFCYAIGKEQLLHQYRSNTGRKKVQGVGQSKRLLGTG
jgi:REP element-mobilizing transposase RayT